MIFFLINNLSFSPPVAIFNDIRSVSILIIEIYQFITNGGSIILSAFADLSTEEPTILHHIFMHLIR